MVKLISVPSALPAVSRALLNSDRSTKGWAARRSRITNATSATARRRQRPPAVVDPPGVLGP
ncbi:hypothetical protein ACNF49_30545 [Actinomadura sp. ATCC 39365]